MTEPSKISDDVLLQETLQVLYGETPCTQDSEDVKQKNPELSKESGCQVQLDNTDMGPDSLPVAMVTESKEKTRSRRRKWKSMGTKTLTHLPGQSNKGYLALKALKRRRCTVCDVLVECQSDLGNHMRQKHPEELPCECSRCGKRFKWPSSVSKHMRIHTAEFVTADGQTRRSEYIIPWTCVGCSRVFNSTRYLYLDISPTTGKDIYKCKVCRDLNVGHQSQVINNQSAALVSVGSGIKASESVTDQIKVGLPFPCSRCSLSFTTELQRTEHYNNAHVPYTCSLCGETFSGKEVYLKLHLTTHTLPYKCESCGERFQTEVTLQVRVSKNTGEKRYRCQKCRDCMGESNRGCAVCGECFDLKSELMNHVETKHPQMRPYNCLECGKRFGKRRSLTIHETLHTMEQSERPFRCWVCGKTFRWNKNLVRHRKKLHPGESPCAETSESRSNQTSPREVPGS